MGKRDIYTYIYASIYYVVYNVGNKSKCEKGRKEWVEDRKKRKREQEIERKERERGNYIFDEI